MSKSLDFNEGILKIINELEKYQKKIERLIILKQNHVDFLGRSADSCFEYPNPEEKYELYLELISKAEAQLEKMKEANEEHLPELINCLKSIIHYQESEKRGGVI